MGDYQFLPGYTLLLSDPVVPDLFSLSEEAQSVFLIEMGQVGQAVQNAVGAERINLEILGNTEPALHAHIFPRFRWEPMESRRRPVWFYDWEREGSRFDPVKHQPVMISIRNQLQNLLHK